MYFQSKLHNNTIYTGSVDQYCLVCDSYLRSEDEAFTHTEKPIHKKNMITAIRLERFKDDQIIKVKKGYYCIYCNILLTTATKVTLHVADVKHQEHKGAQMLNQIGDNVIAFNEIAITKESWHGMFENTCVVCNKDFDNGEAHRSDQQHILNLIQSKCEFGDKYLYRNVDQESFYCLICGNVFSINDKPTHHDGITHKDLYNTGKELKNQIQASIEDIPKIVSSKPNTDNEAKDKVVLKSNKNIDADDAKTSNTPTIKKAKTATAKDSDAATLNITKKAETVHAKKPKARKDHIEESPSNIPKTKDFIGNATKSKKNIDSKMYDCLNVKKFIIRGDDSILRCVLCDIEISQDDLEVHFCNDLHHQMMFKKHNEALNKKNGQNEQINVPIKNLVQKKGKIYLQNPENTGNNTTKTSNATKNVKPRPGHRQLHVEIDPQDIQTKIRMQNQDKEISSDEDEGHRSKILDHVDMLQENNITIDFTSQWARCKRCKEDVPFNFGDLKAHIEKRHMDAKAKELEAKKKKICLACENYMVITNNDVHCKICDVTMTCDIGVMTAHVATDEHSRKAAGTCETAAIKKLRSMDYMKVFFRVESNLGSDIILNNTFALNNYSFHCVIPEGQTLKCVLCEVTIPKDNADQLLEHLNTTAHKMNMGNCNIMCYQPTEFIREILPGKYHCGFCNMVIDSWLLFRGHIMTNHHIGARLHARWSLERCNNLIRNARPLQNTMRERSCYNLPEVLHPLPRSQSYDLQSHIAREHGVAQRQSDREGGALPESPDLILRVGVETAYTPEWGGR